MSGRKQDKRSTSGGTDLNVNPFAGLESAGLAPGESRKPASVSPTPKGGRVEVRREKGHFHLCDSRDGGTGSDTVA